MEIHRNTPATDKGSDLEKEVATEQAELDAEQAQLDAELDAIKQRRAAVQDKAKLAAEAIRNEKIEKRAGLLEDATDWREMARTNPDPDKAKEFLRRAKEAEHEASVLGVELNLSDPAPAEEPETVSLKPLSSNRAIQLMVGLFFAFVLLTWWWGAPLMKDPENAIGQSIIKNAPIRALLSFTLTFLTVLVSVFFIRICFPQFYRIWHNRINSERSLETLLNEAPAWAVLLSLLALFYTFMQLFASFYQALYA